MENAMTTKNLMLDWFGDDEAVVWINGVACGMLHVATGNAAAIQELKSLDSNMSRQLQFDDEDETRDQAYELMRDALAPGKKTGSYFEGVGINAKEKDGSCVVQVGRLAMRVVDWWKGDPIRVVEITASGIADARGPEAASSPDAGI